MIDLGLTTHERHEYEAALKASHRIRVTVRVHDRDEQVVAHLEAPHVTSGSVQVDAKADVTRSLLLTCIDPHHHLLFDGGSPAQGAMYADNFVSVERGIWVTALARWVDVPVFWGPITSFERRGPEVTIEAQGKESLALTPHQVPYPGYTIGKGVSVKTAIRSVMGRLGETRFALPTTLTGQLSTHRAVLPGEEPWKVLVGGAADSHGKTMPGVISKADGHFYLFFDGRGRLTARKRASKSIFAFTGEHLTTHPGFKFDALASRNRVEVTGGTPKGGKGHYRGAASLAANHPLSAAALARNGKPRYLIEFYESDALKSDAACEAKAKEILAAKSPEGVDALFECIPVPHLEEKDTVQLVVDGYAVTFNLNTFTIPLTSDGTMSVGFPTRVRRPFFKRIAW